MNDKVEEQTGTAITETTKHFTKMGLGLSSGAIFIIVGGWFLYTNWDKIDAFSKSLVAVKNNTDLTSASKQFINITYPQEMVELRAELAAGTRKSEALIAGMKIQYDGRINALESWKKEADGADARADTRIGENTSWRVEQEKRATIRIEQQKFRQHQLDELESLFKSHIAEHVDQLKDSNVRMRSEIENLKKEVEKLKEAQ